MEFLAEYLPGKADAHKHTPKGSNSPLFEPELPIITLEEPQVPVAVMVQPMSPVITSSTEQPTEQELISCFVHALRKIEADAKAEMATWDLSLVGQAAETDGATLTGGTKRKASFMDSDSDDDEENSDSDDDDDIVPPHDPDSQRRPKLPIYHPGFALAENIAQRILATFISYITAAIQNGYKDDEAKHLRAEIIKNKPIKYLEAVKLAVAGDTGAGKSALLNAGLGVVNLNVESDSGGACTCVITEFRQSPSTQMVPYAAEVEFFDLNVCIKLVKDLFAQWVAVKQKQRQNPDDVDDQDLNQMKTARDCLQQMFAEQLGFSSVEGFMATATSTTDAKIINQLVRWTTDMHAKFIPEGEMFVYFEANTPESLAEQYHPFTREVPNASFKGNPLRFTPWPLVRIVRVTLNSPVLQQNVVVADVPGVSDVNYFRVENANRYLQSCDMTIVVGKIDRIIDNPSFQQQYTDAFRRRRSGSVILVATRSDDLNDENASTATLEGVAKERLDYIAQKLSDIDTKMKIIDNDMSRNKLDGKAKANKKMKKQKKKLALRQDAFEKQRKEILITSRNKHVSISIGADYRAATGDDAGAPVYCVSNRMYMRHLRGYDMSNERSVPTMTLEQTQIPAFCSNIYVLPSKGRTASLNHHVRVTVPTLLSIVQMSCSTTTLARSSHLVSIVQKSRQEIGARINELLQKFKRTDIKLLYDELADPALQTRFDKQAIKSLIRWESLNAATHKATVNKQGTYSQKKKNLHMNWNEDLLVPVRPVIDMAFRAIIDGSVETFKAEAAQASKEVIRELDDTLKNDPKALACDAYNICFKDNVALYFEAVDQHVEKAASDLKDLLIQVHLHTIRVTPEDYFPEAMETTYATAVNVRSARKGVTMFAARKVYLKEHIPGPTGPFAELAGWARKDANEAVRNVSQRLLSSLDGMLGKVQIAFDRMKLKKENDTPEGQKFRTELHQLVDEARRILNGIAQESLDLCKAYK